MNAPQIYPDVVSDVDHVPMCECSFNDDPCGLKAQFLTVSTCGRDAYACTGCLAAISAVGFWCGACRRVCFADHFRVVPL